MTPAYNRVVYLETLYESLERQTSKNFVWLVVDDGSTDNTEQVIKKYLRSSSFEIQYYKQPNSGKYVAHNTGVGKTMTELFLCVDSDDSLLPDAVENIIEAYKLIKEDDSCAGLLSPRKMVDEKGQTIAYLSNAPEYSTIMGLYNRKQLFGETALVFKTAILKNYLFPVIKNERFMSENIIYNQIDQFYKFYVFNKQYYESAYLPTGMTKNIIKIYWNNPKSTLLMYQNCGALQSDFIKGIKSTACYYAWKKINGLEKITTYRIPLYRRFIARFFVWHYVQVFEKQKEQLMHD